MSQHRLRFNIERLSAWAPGVSSEGEWRAWRNGERVIGSEGEPALRQMPAMMRRHAGRLSKLTCQVAYEVAGDITGTGVPIVFSSRYGDVGRSVELLTELASGGDLSPTSFSLSVHNAGVGLLAMAREDSASCVALAGGDESAEYGIMEACGLIADGAERVLLIVADCPLPSVYSMFAGVNPVTVAFAWAGMVVPARDTGAFGLEWKVVRDEARLGPQLPSGLAALRFLGGDDDELVRVAAERRWRWSRQA